jgi:stage III sporulation protein AG
MSETKKSDIHSENVYIAKLKEFTRDPRFLKAAVFIGIAAMGLILISGLTGSPKPEETLTSDTDIFSYTESYAARVEEKLSKLLAEIEGVGDAEVMVTVGATEEYVYEKERKTVTGGSSSEVVVIDGKDGKNALTSKIITPKITGVVIVCEGGDDSRVAEKIYKTVSTALGLGASRIYVAEKD